MHTLKVELREDVAFCVRTKVQENSLSDVCMQSLFCCFLWCDSKHPITYLILWLLDMKHVIVQICKQLLLLSTARLPSNDLMCYDSVLFSCDKMDALSL